MSWRRLRRLAEGRRANSGALATYELYPYVRLGDEIVGAKHASPPGIEPFWLANPPLTLTTAHFGAMIDVRILADIAKRLRGEEPFTQLPATPLPGLSRGPVCPGGL